MPPQIVRRAWEVYRNDGALSLIGRSRPFVRNNVAYLRDELAPRAYATARQLYYDRAYGIASPSPYELIHIDPTRVEHLLVPQFKKRLSDHGHYVRGGSWDLRKSTEELFYDSRYESRFDRPARLPLENYVLYRAMREHFENDIPWEETEFYEWASGGDIRSSRYGGEANARARLSSLDDLYHSIQHEGYSTQRKLDGDSVLADARTDIAERHEVMVNVGRTGELILEDGRHRFSIARIAGIRRIPVRVFVRHRRWQDLRSEVATASTPDDLRPEVRVRLNHPDLRDLVPGEWVDI